MPIQVTVNDSNEAVTAVVDGKALAAIIPTPLDNKYHNVNPVMTTKSVPHMAFSASPNVQESVQRNIHLALVKAYKSKEGRQLLMQINLKKYYFHLTEKVNGLPKRFKKQVAK